jgi:hypothetical protein
MVSSSFPFESNVAILHKSNQRTRRKYKTNYLRRQKDTRTTLETREKKHNPHTNHTKKGNIY